MTPYSPDRRSIIPRDDLRVMLEYARQAPPGAFVEVGVYRGGSALRLYEIAEQQGRSLWLFDTFAGHPATDGDPEHPVGRYADCADPVALLREMPKAHILIGEIPSCFGAALAIAIGPVAFAHVDVDLYESTRDAIAALTPLMASGGLLYFDDYPFPECAGARRAVDEAFPVVETLESGRVIVRCP